MRGSSSEDEDERSVASTEGGSEEQEAEYLPLPPVAVAPPLPPQQQAAVVDLAVSSDEDDDVDEQETQELDSNDDEPLAASVARIVNASAPPGTARARELSALAVVAAGGSSVNAELMAVERPQPTALKKGRKRLRSAVKASPAPMIVTKAQPTECTICYDPCMISGRHRLVALKCGHLFGKKCIERWVLERKSCPNCNVAVKKAEIRPLFSDHVAVVDNSGVEGMKQMYEAEKSKRIQVETELSRAKLQMEILATETQRHKEEALRWRKELTQLQCKVASERFTSTALSQQQLSQPQVSGSGWSPNRPPHGAIGGGGFLTQQVSPSGGRQGDSKETLFPPVSSSTQPSSAASAGWSYKEVYRYPLQNSRVFDIARSCFMVCVGEELSTTKFGIVKMSAVDPRHCIKIAGHQSPVRDLKISKNEDLVVTVAFDGKLVVSNLNSQSVVLQCPLPPGKRQGWSCTFSDVDPFALYCGFHDGSVAKYDMRKPIAEAVVTTFAVQEKQPVHALRLFKALDGKERLVAATFSSISIWNDCNNSSSSSSSSSSSGFGSQSSSSSEPRVADARAAIPSCCSLGSVQTRPASVLVSSRTLPAAPATHSVFDLTQALGSMPTPQSVVTGHRTPPVLARSAVWEAQDGAIVVASGDDESKQVVLWDAATNRVRHRLRPFPGNQVVIDVQHSVAQGKWSNRKALFGVLSSQQFALYSS